MSTSPTTQAAGTAIPHVLILTTSHTTLGATGRPTGVWLEELAVPMHWLAERGANITLASIAGGAVPLDPGSIPAADAPGAQSQHEFLQTHASMLAASVPVADLRVGQYDALLLPGGHGTVWDLPQGAAAVVEAFFAAGKPIAAVCHGPAGLVGARRPDGLPLVTGLRVNAFTDAEERLAELETVVPFLLEQRLRELGARFEAAAPWQPHVTEDTAITGTRLITGQNPASSLGVARALWNALAKRFDLA
jgi:putative intracellular protease/amidase